MKATSPLRVDFTHNEHDQRVRNLAAMGYSTRYIMKQTGLTKCQVTYRVSAAHVSRLSARNGETPIARLIEKEVYGLVDQYFMAKPGG